MGLQTVFRNPQRDRLGAEEDAGDLFWLYRLLKRIVRPDPVARENHCHIPGAAHPDQGAG